LVPILGTGLAVGVLLSSVNARSQSKKHEMKPLIVGGVVVPSRHIGARSLVIVPSCTSCSYRSFDLAKALRLAEGKVVIVDDGAVKHTARANRTWAKRGEHRTWSMLSEGAVYDLDSSGRISGARWAF
jgi:hypothetical protein